MPPNKPKVALVTGAGRGLGADLASRLADEGYAVAIHYHSSQQGAATTREKILARGGQAQAFPADLSHSDQATQLVEEVRKHFGGGLDLLINNSGTYDPVPLAEMEEKDWLTGFHSTATAAFFTSQAALPSLRESGQGRIINLGDSSADRPTAREMALGYHIGKTGVWMLTRSYAQAEAQHGVTVNMISPGYLENSQGLPSSTEVPAQRFGTFADIWAAVHFLLQPQASYITGTDFMVTGGWNLR